MISDVAMASKVTAWFIGCDLWEGVRAIGGISGGRISVAIDPDGPLGELLHGLDTEVALELDEFLETFGWGWDLNDAEEGIVLSPLLEETEG